MPPRRTSITIGQLFADRYRVERLLGRGGMGSVYAVFDEQLKEPVALKTLSPKLAAHEQALARFQREVRLARRVTHPQVARTHDIGVHEGVHYLTMELVEGETLKQRLAREGALSPEETVRIGRALCDGLASAHEAGVLHRDMKPANVMLAQDGRVVITDFGVALPASDSDDVMTIGFIGTPRYTAPEVLEGTTFDERSDIWALGLILYEMLTGTRYRLTELGDDDPTRTDTVQASLRPDAPPALELLVRSMLQLAPQRRPRSARAVAEELSSLAEPPSTPAPTVDAPPAPSAPLPNGRRLVVVPFKSRGGHDADELAEVLGEELADVLSHNAGMQVLAHRSHEIVDEGVTAAGLRAGADWVVSGTVMRRGERVRISVRLAEVATGTQLYSERFDAKVVDVFDLQDRIALRIGEALRVEVTLVARRGEADARAIECYLRGRRKLQNQRGEIGLSIPDLEEAIARAPGFSVAIAAHAIATVRLWWAMSSSPEGVALQRAAEHSVARARAHAADIPEAHLAAGLWACHRGEYQAAVDAFAGALDIAPTYALAHDQLGRLECEAGRGATGAKRIELAYGLDPMLVGGQVWLARWLALSGRTDEALARLDELDSREGVASINRVHLRMRIAAWRGDEATLRWCFDQIPVSRFAQLGRLRDYIQLVLGEMAIDEYLPKIQDVAASSTNQRFTTFLFQLAAEACGLLNETEAATDFVTRASKMALVDLDWLERCPALASIRDQAGFEDARDRVKTRAALIWAT